MEKTAMDDCMRGTLKTYFANAKFRLQQKQKSRAVRGSEDGGPTRTRTVDQRIMSCLETLQAQ
jgi:hypothetical protein